MRPTLSLLTARVCMALALPEIHWRMFFLRVNGLGYGELSVLTTLLDEFDTAILRGHPHPKPPHGVSTFPMTFDGPRLFDPVVAALLDAVSAGVQTMVGAADAGHTSLNSLVRSGCAAPARAAVCALAGLPIAEFETFVMQCAELGSTDAGARACGGDPETGDRGTRCAQAGVGRVTVPQTASPAIIPFEMDAVSMLEIGRDIAAAAEAHIGVSPTVKRPTRTLLLREPLSSLLDELARGADVPASWGLTRNEALVDLHCLAYKVGDSETYAAAKTLEDLCEMAVQSRAGHLRLMDRWLCVPMSNLARLSPGNRELTERIAGALGITVGELQAVRQRLGWIGETHAACTSWHVGELVRAARVQR